MLTDDGLTFLRMSATLALTLPTIKVRVASPTLRVAGALVGCVGAVLFVTTLLPG